MPYGRVLNPVGPRNLVLGLSLKCLWRLTWVVGDTHTPSQDTARAFSVTSAESRKREVILTAFMATIAGKAIISLHYVFGGMVCLLGLTRWGVELHFMFGGVVSVLGLARIGLV
jgi:hypothetical protein